MDVIVGGNFANFWRAHYRLYQNEILQEDMRLKTFFKLYKMCILERSVFCRSRRELSHEYFGLLWTISLQNLISIQPRTSILKFEGSVIRVKGRICRFGEKPQDDSSGTHSGRAAARPRRQQNRNAPVRHSLEPRVHHSYFGCFVLFCPSGVLNFALSNPVASCS